jgi:hypothetical protein
MAAFLGAIAGVPPVVTVFVQRSSAKAQREHDKAERDTQREHDSLTALRSARAQQIATWRNGLSKSALTYQQWTNMFSSVRQRQEAVANGEWGPNVVSDAWFQSLRPRERDAEGDRRSSFRQVGRPSRDLRRKDDDSSWYRFVKLTSIFN